MSGTGDGRPRVAVAIAFDSLDVTYTEQELDGTIKSTTTTSWSRR